jgi:hypothetical protein
MDGFGVFRRETGCHPAPPQALSACIKCVYLILNQACVISPGRAVSKIQYLRIRRFVTCRIFKEPINDVYRGLTVT